MIHLIAAWYSVGHYHDDEYHQILNFAAAKLGTTDTETLRWEYQDQLRSGLQPFIAVVTKQPLQWLSIESPFIHAFILRLLSACLSLIAICLFIQSLKNEFANKTVFNFTAFFLLFLWLQVFLNIRFSSEGWAASLFLMGFSVYRLNPSKHKHLLFLTGILFGVSFLSRYQVGLMLLGFGLWMLFIYKEKLSVIGIMLAGSAIVLICGFFIDWWLYNEPVLTTWNYLHTNLIQGRVEAFTHEPWWFYFYYSAVQVIPPITLLYPLLLILFWILLRSHPITWITVPFVLFHNYLGHKEMRFLFPMLPFVPVILTMSLEKLGQFSLFNKPKLFNTFRYVVYLSIGLNALLLLLVATLPASKEVAMWQTCLSSFQPQSNQIIFAFDQDELKADFYNVNNLALVAVSDIDMLKQRISESDEQDIYIATRRGKQAKALAESGLNYSLECEITPGWLQLININNWTSRASLWRLWKLNQVN